MIIYPGRKFIILNWFFLGTIFISATLKHLFYALFEEFLCQTLSIESFF